MASVLLIVSDDQSQIGELILGFSMYYSSDLKVVSFSDIGPRFKFSGFSMILLDQTGESEEPKAILKKIKLNPKYNLIPVVSLTKSGRKPSKVKGINVSSDAYARWPSKAETIIKRMESTKNAMKEFAHKRVLTRKIIFLVQNELQFLFEVNNIISEQFALAGFAEDEIVNLRLTLDELGTNAIRHGNDNNPHRVVTIHCYIYEKYLSVTIEDQGKGFDVKHIPDPTTTERILLPSGRGIFIARQLMDRVQYHGNGNKVEFVKDIPLQKEKSSVAQ